MGVLLLLEQVDEGHAAGLRDYPPVLMDVRSQELNRRITRLSTRFLRRHQGFTLVEMMLVVAVTFVVMAFSIYVYLQMARNMRTAGDGRNLGAEVSLAKMRAPAYFTQARVYADLSAQTFHIEVWLKSSSQWSTEGGIQNLSPGSSFGFGTLGTPPPNTQAALAQAPTCLNNSGGALANTACIVYNSRGIPIDSTGAPTANDALYVTDGQQVYGVTVSSTGLIQNWNTLAKTASWKKR